MRHAFVIVMLVAFAGPAAGQLRPRDSVAVIGTIERFHAALRADDSLAVRGMLGPAAVILDQGKIMRMSENQSQYLASLGRWGRAINRQPGPINVQILGVTAWAYSITRISAVAAPDAIRGQVSELVVLTRLGETWFINAIMWSTASPDS